MAYRSVFSKFQKAAPFNLFTKFKQAPRGVKIVTAGWTAFATSHLVLSHPPIRDKLTDAMGGQTNFRYAYGALALAIMSTTFGLHWRCPPELRGRVLHNLYRASSYGKAASPGYKWSIMLRAIGAFFITDSFVSAYRNPLCMTANEPESPRAMQRMYQVAALQRVTRHHEWLGYAIYALGNLIAFNRMSEVILWGAVPVFCAIGTAHQEYRLRKSKPEFYFNETSILPFQAILDGRQPGYKVWTEVSAASYAAFFCTLAMFVFWP